jgi:pimeloyl-[acyl-carrier protein] synthase
MSNFEELLVSPEFMANPYPVLRSIREQEPVLWSDAIGGWLLTRYDDVVASLKNNAIFSNEDRFPKTVESLTPEKRAKFKVFVDHYAVKGLIHSDPPNHTRLRTLVNQEFTPKVVEQMRPRIQQVVDGLLEEAEDKQEMDVVHFATALPIGVIAEILGVPSSDQHLIREWTNDILRFQGVNKPSEEDLSRAQKGLMGFRPYVQQMIEERRRQPRQDLMSKFVAVESAGERLTEAELINTFVTLIIAGHETTLSLISNSIYTLLANPDQFQLLRDNPGLLESTLEESLRYESPVSRLPRLVKEDTKLGGKDIKRGETVFQLLNAANRDPAYFTDPDKFNIQRQKNRHIAFGFGAHFCVGAGLARTEAFIAIGSIIQRFPKLQLVNDEANWDIGSRTFRIQKSLPVRF